MNQAVIKPAVVWTCPDCRRDNYEKIEMDGSPAQVLQVQCRRCGGKFPLAGQTAGIRFIEGE